jgi:hypothetical protein
VRNESEQKEARRKASQEGRRKAKEEMEILKDKTKKKVEMGEMTEDQRDDYLASLLTGVAKLQFENNSLKRRLKAYETGNSETIQLQDARQQASKAAEEAHYHQRRYLEICRNMSLMFNPERFLQHGTYLERSGFQWPTTVASQSYFDIYAVSWPWGDWPNEPPTEEKDWRACSPFIHPDKSISYIGALGGPEGCHKIMAIWNASAQVVFSERKGIGYNIENAMELISQKHAAEWGTAKLKVQRVLLPKGDQIPCFLLAHWVDNAAGATRLMQD